MTMTIASPAGKREVASAGAFSRRGRRRLLGLETMRWSAVTHDQRVPHLRAGRLATKTCSLHVDDNGVLKSTSILVEAGGRGRSRRHGGVVQAE